MKIESLELLKGKDKRSLKRSISTWRSKIEQAHKVLPKLVYAYTRDIEEGMIAETVRMELGFDLRLDIQHLYQLRNIVAAIDTGRTKLTEADYDRISNSALVAFHKHLSGEHEEAAIQILREGYKVKAKLRDLGRTEPGPAPCPRKTTATPSVSTPTEPVATVNDAGEKPVGKPEPSTSAPSGGANHNEGDSTPAAPDSVNNQEGDAIEVNILSDEMWLKLVDQLEQLTPAELSQVENILQGFVQEIANCKATAAEAA